MEDLIQQIRKGLENNLYYLGLHSTLAIPDICAAINSTDGVATGKKYREWYDKYVTPNFNTLTAEECYNYRCTALHQGTSKPQKVNDYERIIFIEPSINNLIINVKRMKGGSDSNYAIMINLQQFCNSILSGAETWIKEKRGTEPFDSNYNKLMKRYPSGIGSYINGVPVISQTMKKNQIISIIFC